MMHFFWCTLYITLNISGDIWRTQKIFNQKLSHVRKWPRSRFVFWCTSISVRPRCNYFMPHNCKDKCPPQLIQKSCPRFSLVFLSFGCWHFSWFLFLIGFWHFSWFFLSIGFWFFSLVFLSMGFWHFFSFVFWTFSSFNLNRMLRYFDYIAGCWYGHWPDWKWNGAYNGTIHPLNQNNTSV